jgi:hypothetical protein
VIVRDANTIHLGGQFDGAAVNTLNDTITINNHNLQTGDFVYYHNNGLSSVGGLGTGERYRVFVVDKNTIKLQVPGQATPSTTVGLGNISGRDDHQCRTSVRRRHGGDLSRAGSDPVHQPGGGRQRRHERHPWVR